MREIVRTKLTAGGIVGALVLGIGAIAGATAGSGSSDPVPASHKSVDDTVGSVPSTAVTSPTVGVTTPTLDDDDAFDDHGDDGVEDDDAFDDHGNDAVEDGEHDGGQHEVGDDNSGPGSTDDDRSGSNSGPG